MLEDEPVRELASDHLGLEPFAKVIAGTAIGTPGPFTIGVFAHWGEGKTSVLRLAKSLVDSRKDTDQAHVVTVWFNAWQYEREEHPIVPLVASIVGAVEERRRELELAASTTSDRKKEATAQRLSTISRALRAIAYGFSANLKVKVPGFAEIESGFVAKEMIERYDKLQQPQGAGDPLLDRSLYHNAFELLERVSRPATADGGPPLKIVVFIDDLDRCLPPRSLAVLESVKLVLAQPGFIFALAVDRRVLESFLRKRYEDDFGMEEYEESSKLYLDKIVQLPLALPSHENRFKRLLEGLLANSSAFRSGRNKEVAGALRELEAVLATGSDFNPRNLVRFINNLIVDLKLWKALEPDEKVAKLMELAIVSRMLQQHLGDDYRDLVRDDGLCKLLLESQFDLENLAAALKRDPAAGMVGSQRRLQDLVTQLDHKRALLELFKSAAGRRWLANRDERLKVDSFLVAQRETSSTAGPSSWEIVDARIRKILGRPAGSPISADDLAQVKTLNLSWSTLDDLSPVARLISLESLDLYGTPMTDAGLLVLAPLGKLADLDLGETKVTDAGLPALVRLPSLVDLKLGRTQVSDHGLQVLAKLTSLTSLNLAWTPVTDRGLSALASLSFLDYLRLLHTKVTDEGLRALATLPKLTRLDLEGTLVTDRGVDVLAGMTGLKFVDLTGAAVSQQGVESLKGKRPDLDVKGP